MWEYWKTQNLDNMMLAAYPVLKLLGHFIYEYLMDKQELTHERN